MHIIYYAEVWVGKGRHQRASIGSVLALVGNGRRNMRHTYLAGWQ